MEYTLHCKCATVPSTAIIFESSDEGRIPHGTAWSPLTPDDFRCFFSCRLLNNNGGVCAGCKALVIAHGISSEEFGSNFDPHRPEVPPTCRTKHSIPLTGTESENTEPSDSSDAECLLLLRLNMKRP